MLFNQILKGQRYDKSLHCTILVLFFFQLGCYKNSFFRILSFSLLTFPVSSHFWVFNFFWLRDIFHFSRFANIGEVASGESGQCGSPPCRVVWVQNVISDNLLLWWLKCNWCNIISDAVWCCVHWKSILHVLFLFFVLCLCLCQCQQFLSQTARYTSINSKNWIITTNNLGKVRYIVPFVKHFWFVNSVSQCLPYFSPLWRGLSVSQFPPAVLEMSISMFLYFYKLC